MTKLSPDATIATVWHTLVHQRDYMSGVSQRLYRCQKDHGNAAVVIGVTGKGIKPCYRITFDHENQRHIFGSWWDNHDALSKSDAENANWSTRSMTFSQVAALMHRYFKPPVVR
ncbi:MAG: hypothetical protein ACRCXM_08610 [Beijerinckiaceae bacterium]